MNGPHCGTSDTKRFSIVHQTGSTSGLLAELVHGRTQLTRRTAPPGPESSGGGFFVVAVASAQVVVVALLYLSEVGFTRGGMGFAAVAVFMVLLALVLLGTHHQDMETRPDRMGQWHRTWLCLRCGRDFQEESPRVSNRGTLQDRVRELLRTEGKVLANKFYMEQTGKDLVKAKAYVESL
jgi:hypothetical protein